MPNKQSFILNPILKRAILFGTFSAISPFLLIPSFIIVPIFRFLGKVFYWDLGVTWDIGVLGRFNIFPTIYGLFVLFIIGFVLSLCFSLLRRKKKLIALAILLIIPAILLFIYSLSIPFPSVKCTFALGNFKAAVCWKKLAIAKGVSTYCDRINYFDNNSEGEFTRSGCYYQLAKDTLNVDLCEKVISSSSKSRISSIELNFNQHKNCLYDLALKLKSPEICAKMDPFYFSFYDPEDSSRNTADSYNDRDSCYFNLARMGINPAELCEKVNNKDFRLSCQQKYGKI